MELTLTELYHLESALRDKLVKLLLEDYSTLSEPLRNHLITYRDLYCKDMQVLIGRIQAKEAKLQSK